jgi:hypothetical protein
MFSGATQVISVNNQNQNIMKYYNIVYRKLNITIHEAHTGGFYFKTNRSETLGEAFEEAVKYVDLLHETKYHSVEAFSDALNKHALVARSQGQNLFNNRVLEILLDNYEPK